MRRIAIILIILFAALLAVYYFMKKDSFSTVSPEVIEFAVSDAEAITKVVMRNRDGKKVILEKKDDTWWVNDTYPAFEPLVQSLINKTLTKIEVKGPVATAARQNIIREMVTNAIKVTVFSGNEKIRSYYVGAEDPTQEGTYMYIENAETPYVTYVPGMDGYLTPQYHLIAEDWYSRSIFDLEPDEIKWVEVIYNMKPEQSFSISRDGEQFVVSPEIAGQPLNQIAAKSYLTLFKFKNYEGFPDYLTQETKDSIRTSEPYARIIVTTTKGKEIELKVYEKGRKDDRSVVDKDGNVLAYDVERYFAQFTGFPELVTIQEFVFGQILAERTDFFE